MHLRSGPWIAFAALLLTASGASAQNRTIGLVALETTNVDRQSERAANAQLRLTLAAIAGVTVTEASLPDGRKATDVAALGAALTVGALDRVVGGELVFEGEGGRIRLVSIDAAGQPHEAKRSFPNHRQEELLSAVEAAACESLDVDSSADGCQGSLALAGAVENAELLVDGKVVAKSPFVNDVPLPLGAHMVQLRQGQAVSQARRFFVHYGASVKLTLAAECNRLFVLDSGESPICDDSVLLSEAIQSTLLVQPEPPKWHAIVTAAAGAALLVGGLVMGLQAQTHAADIRRAYEGSGLGPDDQAKVASMRQSQLLRNVGLGAGALVTAAGVTLLVVDF